MACTEGTVWLALGPPQGSLCPIFDRQGCGCYNHSQAYGL